MRKTFFVLALVFLAGCSEKNVPTSDLSENTKYFFTIYGDSRDGNDIFSVLLNRSWQYGQPMYVVHVGDMISSASSTYQWPSFKTVLEEHMFENSVFPVVGNHDVDSQKTMQVFGAVFPKAAPTGYYSEMVEDCFCIFLNSEDTEIDLGTIGPTQLAWLESLLKSEEAQKALFRAVYVHRPVFPQNHHKETPLKPTKTLHELFVKYKVRAVIAGHEHSYTRQEKDGVHYIISGGAGAPLFQPAGKDSAFYHFLVGSFVEPGVGEPFLNFRVVDFYGIERDEFEIRF